MLTKIVQEAEGGERRVRKIGFLDGFDEQEMTEASVTTLSPVANRRMEKCSADTHTHTQEKRAHARMIASAVYFLV